MTPALRDAIRTTLRGFDDEIWVRNTAQDADAEWAMKLLPFVTALAVLQRAIEHDTEATHGARE